jgi:ArsR family transcriptional regulator
MHVSTLANVLKAVAEESRLKLLCILKEGEHCVCELEEHVDLSQSLISHHLRDLKDGGFVSAEKRGLKVYYSLTNLGKEIVEKLFSITELGVDIG